MLDLGQLNSDDQATYLGPTRLSQYLTLRVQDYPNRMSFDPPFDHSQEVRTHLRSAIRKGGTWTLWVRKWDMTP